MMCSNKSNGDKSDRELTTHDVLAPKGNILATATNDSTRFKTFESTDESEVQSSVFLSADLRAASINAGNISSAASSLTVVDENPHPHAEVVVPRFPSTPLRSSLRSPRFSLLPSGRTTKRNGDMPRAAPMSPLKAYFHGARRTRSSLSTKELPYEQGPSGKGMYTPAGLFFFFTKLTVPLAYIYIAAYVIRDIALRMDYLDFFAELPVLKGIFQTIERFPLCVHTWCIIEAIFYVCLRLHIQWLQYKCPLEAALASAPMAELEERRELFLRILDCEAENPTHFIEGWFFDAPLETISRYDMLDFLCWCLYEGRSQEHLTESEADQLREFLYIAEYRISVHKYGLKTQTAATTTLASEDRERRRISDENDGNTAMNYEDDVAEEYECSGEEENDDLYDDAWSTENMQEELKRSPSSNDVRCKYGPEPAKIFRFHVNDHGTTSTFFTSLFESMGSYPNPASNFFGNVNERVQNVNEYVEERVQGLRNFVQTKREQMQTAEVNALSTAQDMYQNLSDMSEDSMVLVRQYLREMRQHISDAESSAMQRASIMYDSVYFTFIQKGGSVDKSLHAFRQATAAQLLETWQGLKKRSSAASTAMSPSPEMLALRTKQLKKQLRNYRHLLIQMREKSSTYSAKQMADLFHKISHTNEALWEAETIARNAFLRASGFAKQMMPSVPRGLGGVGVGAGVGTGNILGQQQAQPLPYAKYSFDSIFDVAIYPLGFHLIILFATEGCLRVIMHRKGFERRTVGQTAYYFHPGRTSPAANDDDRSQDSFSSASSVGDERVPIVFCHGIGIGLIYYMQLIDMFLAQGRPLFLPELSFVTAFRTWQSPSSVLTPQAVASTLTSMLYENGMDQAVFVGHSYGSSWLSYMCKLAPDRVKGLIFLDPICFCLHLPFLTKQFVYRRADPGSTSYFVRTDVNVNWTIQRAFPWTRVALFVEQLPPDVQVAVFLSQNDTLVPTNHVSSYLQRKGDASLRHYPEGCHSHFYATTPISVTIFGNVGHGDWCENYDMSMAVSHAVDTLCRQVETKRVESALANEKRHGFRPTVSLAITEYHGMPKPRRIHTL